MSLSFIFIKQSQSLDGRKSFAKKSHLKEKWGRNGTLTCSKIGSRTLLSWLTSVWAKTLSIGKCQILWRTPKTANRYKKWLDRSIFTWKMFIWKLQLNLASRVSVLSRQEKCSTNVTWSTVKISLWESWILNLLHQEWTWPKITSNVTTRIWWTATDLNFWRRL